MTKKIMYQCATCGKEHEAVETKVFLWVQLELGVPTTYQGHYCSITCLKDYLTLFDVPEGVTIQ